MFFVVLATALCGFEPYRTVDGVPVRWPSDAALVVHADASPDGSFAAAAVADAMRTAFDAWLGGACPAADPPRVDTRPAAPTIVTTPGQLDEDDGVVSLVWFADAATWNQRFGQLELARTISIHRRLSGELVDADIAVNFGGFDFTLDSACSPDRYDFLSMLTHEVGHVLGLDHSDVAGATMARRSDPGECDKRTLEPDDIAGICATYSVVARVEPDPGPEPEPEPAPEVTPETAGSETAELPAARNDGCATAPASGAGLALLTLWLCGQTRRRRASGLRVPYRRCK